MGLHVPKSKSNRRDVHSVCFSMNRMTSCLCRLRTTGRSVIDDDNSPKALHSTIPSYGRMCLQWTWPCWASLCQPLEPRLGARHHVRRPAVRVPAAGHGAPRAAHGVAANSCTCMCCCVGQAWPAHAVRAIRMGIQWSDPRGRPQPTAGLGIGIMWQRMRL